MTTSGWIIMAISVGLVSVLFLWSITKVLVTPGESEKMHGFEFETPDETTDKDPGKPPAGT